MTDPTHPAADPSDANADADTAQHAAPEDTADTGGGPDLDHLANILEAAMLASGEALSLDRLQGLFREEEAPGRKVLRAALAEVSSRCTGRGFELAEVGSGFRLQVRKDFSPWISRLWDERPPRYSRALLETLAITAYRQPVTRGDIEEVRGVAVSTNIMRTLLEREWVRVVGHRDVPGKPAMYGTTRGFLDYFGLKSLDELPTLAELKDLERLAPELPLSEGDAAPAPAAGTEAPADDALPDTDTDTGTDTDTDTDTDASIDSPDGDDAGAAVEPDRTDP